VPFLLLWQLALLEAPTLLLFIMSLLILLQFFNQLLSLDPLIDWGNKSLHAGLQSKKMLSSD